MYNILLEERRVQLNNYGIELIKYFWNSWIVEQLKISNL